MALLDSLERFDDISLGDLCLAYFFLSFGVGGSDSSVEDFCIFFVLDLVGFEAAGDSSDDCDLLTDLVGVLTRE